MSTLGYSITISIVCGLYLAFLLMHKKYRLIIPSTIHSFTWLVVGVLIALTLSGEVGKNTGINSSSDYDLVVKFILGLVVSSIIGFSLAHILTPIRYTSANNSCALSSETLDYIVKKYRWILYVCFVIGLVLLFFLISIFGFNSLGDYRLNAVTLEYSGYGAIAQQLSGHAMILGGFYLAVLGYKHGKDGQNFIDFIICILLFSAPNIAIAGRSWIITSLLPYFVGYFLPIRQLNLKIKWSEVRKLLILLLVLLSLFAILGVFRGNQDVHSRSDTVNKFLYYTDGSRMTNMVLHQFPPGSFRLEYGKSEFLGKWLRSPMADRFYASIAHDPGLASTVKSAMPYLYYDYGYKGGIIMWGVFCFILELLCASLQQKNSIICFIIYSELAQILFQAPIGNIFLMAVPVFEWIIILYLFRKRLFPI